MVHDEDSALFRKAVGEVAPIADRNSAILEKTPPPARVRTRFPSHELPDVLSDGILGDTPCEYLKNGVSRASLKKLARSKIEDSLDLHGNTTEQARRLLQNFLHEASSQGLRTVQVIHGKGANSPNGEAILRELTRNWLSGHPEVLAFCPAPAHQGGSGAALVLLRNNSANRVASV